MIHSIIHFIFNVVIVMMDIFQLICLINILTYDFSKFEMLEYLYKNWSFNLIKSIKIEYQSNNTEYLTNNLNSNIEPLINISFPGIIPGCDCTLYNDNIYQGQCSKNLLSNNCSNVEQIETKILNSIYLPEINNVSNNNSIIIYIERYQNLSYKDLYNKNEDFFISEDDKCVCDKIYEVCYDCGVIDSLGNRLCLTSNKGIENNCYKINLEYDDSLNNNKLVKDLENIFSNKNIQYPAEFITLYDNNTACILQDESISFPKIKYNLIYSNNITTLINSRIKNSGCTSNIFFGIMSDVRWRPIYFFPFENLFEQNLKNNLKKLSKFPYDETFKKNFSINYRSFIGLNKKCTEYISYIGDNLINYEMEIKLRYILFLFFCMIFFPSFLLFFMMISQIDILSLSQKLIFGFTFSSAVFIFLENMYYELIDMDEKNEKMKIIANNYCSDDLTNNLFFAILNDFKNLKNNILYCSYWTVIMLSVSVGKIILIFTKSCKMRIMLSFNFSNYNIISRIETQLLI